MAFELDLDLLLSEVLVLSGLVFSFFTLRVIFDLSLGLLGVFTYPLVMDRLRYRGIGVKEEY